MAVKAKEQTERAREKEQLQLAVTEYNLYSPKESELETYLLKRKGKDFDNYVIDNSDKSIQLTKGKSSIIFDYRGNILEKYVIHYNLNGGTNEENAITSYYKGTTKSLPIPIKEGAQFLGWLKSKDDFSSNNVISSITSDIEGDLELYAYWLDELDTDLFTFTTTGDSATITGFSAKGLTEYEAGNIITLVIPSKYNGLEVKNIGANAFYSKDKITKLVIPDNITELSNGAFIGCTGIQYLKIPISLPLIYPIFGGNGQCTTILEEIYFSKGTKVGVNYNSSGGNIYSIMDSIIYKSRDNLRKVTLEKGITSIGNYTLYKCNKIEEQWENLINNKDDLINIGDGAFNGCTQIKGELIFSNTINKINYQSFTDCVGITKLVIPDNITELSNGAFVGCTGIQYLKIPISLPLIHPIFGGNGQCTTILEEIYFSKGTEAGVNYNSSGGNIYCIMDSIIYRSRDNLRKVTLEKGIFSIGDYMFKSIDFTNKTKLYYTGISTEWEAMIKSTTGNPDFSNIEINYIN